MNLNQNGRVMHKGREELSFEQHMLRQEYGSFLICMAMILAMILASWFAIQDQSESPGLLVSVGYLIYWIIRAIDSFYIIEEGRLQQQLEKLKQL